MEGLFILKNSFLPLLALTVYSKEAEVQLDFHRALLKEVAKHCPLGVMERLCANLNQLRQVRHAHFEARRDLVSATTELLRE